jgi:pyruvate dehydrogenase E2 component (dihydrolipoamide acetyltransferase)
MQSEIKLSKLKEGVDSVVVQELLVGPGEAVQKDQPLMTVNADKSTFDVKAPMAGKLVKFSVKVDDEIKIGAAYCVIDGANGEAPAKEKPKEAPKEAPRAAAPKEPTPDRPDPAKPAPAPLAAPGVYPASPSTRWLARKLGIDLATVRGTGPNGRITEDDVKNARGGSAPAGAGIAIPPMPRFEDFGPVKREKLSAVRKITAQRMSLSWTVVPHVTQNDIADITDLEAFRKQQDAKGVKLTVLAFALKASAIALKMFPTFNSSLDLASNQLVLKEYYHVGVAVDTKGGLLVPVIRDVDKKSVEQLAKELVETGEKARAGQADMNGGTFTITNLGGIGGTGFTPIVNYPEVAILGMSRSRLQPVIKDGAVVPRLILPLSLSYDHRVIDGATATRFARVLADMLENPWMMVMKG